MQILIRIIKRTHENARKRLIHTEKRTMTCQDCIHIQTDEDKGRYHCEECIYGDTYVSLDCPINRWCDNKFEPKEDSWESISK